MKIQELDTYKTIQVLALACFAVHFIFKVPYILQAGIILLILPLVVYKLAYYITYGWLKFSHVLGAVNSKIILSIVFFIFLTPIALIFQLTGKKIQLKSNSRSDFHERNQTYTPKDLENTW